MTLRRREYLFEGTGFVRGTVKVRMYGETKQYKGYVKEFVGLAQLHGKRWSVVHMPSGRVASARTSKNPKGDFKTLKQAKLYGDSIFAAFDATGVRDYDNLPLVQEYGEYVADGGTKTFDTWKKGR